MKKNIFLDIDEIQGFQASRDKIRIIMKHEYIGRWRERNDVLTIMEAIGVQWVEIDAFVNC